MSKTPEVKETCRRCALVLDNVATLECRDEVCPADETCLVEIEQFLVTRAFCFAPRCRWMFMRGTSKVCVVHPDMPPAFIDFSTGDIEEIVPFKDPLVVLPMPIS